MPSTELEEEQTSSQGDTEPLTFEDDADAEGEMDEDQDMLEADATNAMMPSSSSVKTIPQGASGSHASSIGINDTDMAGGEAEDEDAEVDSDADEEVEGNGDGDDDDDGMGSDDDEDDGQEIDDISRSQTTAGNISPSKVAAGATFSDESDLTDEPDEEDEDAEGEEEEEEGEEGEDNEEDEGDEDEAAKGLAALTSGQVEDASITAGTTNSGLDSLAVLAAAEAGEESQGEEDTDNDSIAGSQVRSKSRKKLSAIPRRTATRLNEFIVASPQLSEDDNDDEEEEEEEAEEESNNGQRSLLKNLSTPNKGNRGLSSLIGLSNMAKSKAKQQGATGILAGAPSIAVEGLGSGLPSAATSREASPTQDEGDEGELGEDDKNDLEQERDEAGTPAQEIDEALAEDEPTTDEAALRRQEAMEALAKIEIGFALLRDKLYLERMDEVSKEGEMILDGTHPDLIHLSNLIENRRERKLKLVDKWFEQEEKQYERVAKAEEAAAWNHWRNEVVELRKQQMNEAARKRRKLDREKRSLDGPRPARRHQTFETELIRNPDYDRKMRVHYQHNNKKGKLRDENEIGAFVAYPDLRGAADHESWMDMQQMGIATDPRFVEMGPGAFYRPEEEGMDPYGMYPMEQPAGFIPYDVPPAAEMAPLERSYNNGGRQHAYVVDNYGRPLSPPPPPAQHAFNNAPAQRGGSRTADSYAQVEPSHHTHSSYSNSKVNRRTSPLTEERDLKHNAPIRTSGQRLNSPPISSHQGVRQPSSTRGPSSQYPKQGHSISEEGFYHPSSKSSMTAVGPSSINRHAQEQHFSR